jgi:anti-anti-sigma factor
LDSSAVGALVELARQGRELGGDLTLVGLSERIYKTLAVLHLGSFFRIFPDLPGSLITNIPTGPNP